MNTKKTILILLGFLIILGIQSCTTHYYVTLKDEPKTVPPSVIRAKFKVEKKNIFRRILFLPAVPAGNLVPENFSRKENGVYIATESQLNIKPNVQAFQIYTVLLLDNSLSIGDANLTKLRDAAIKLISLKQDYQKYAIAVFSGDSKLNLITDFSSNKDTLTAAINKIKKLGDNSTNLYGAINNALDLLSAKELTVREEFMATYQVIVFTDGADTQGQVTLSDVLTKRNKKTYEIIPIVVQSSEIDKYSLRMLTTMKYLWGTGKYYQAENFDKLSTVFAEMQADMENFANSHYYLEYMSPKRGDVLYNFSIIVEPENQILKYINRAGVKVWKTDNTIQDYFNSKDFYSVQKGICVTVDNDFKVSENVLDTDIITFTKNEEKDIHLFSVGGLTTYPQYTYSLNNSNFSYSKIEEKIDDWIIIKSGSTKGSESILTITDKQNNFTKTITLKVE